jgi:uncharacterized Zn finger protein (UPF0148 family)
MAQVVALKCPSCGAPLEKNEMKCQYCGAELVLLPDSSAFSLRSQSTCPKCGAINDRSSWFCPNCNTILTKDIEPLRRLQKKVKFVQEQQKEELKKKVPSSFIEDLGPDESIYMTLSREQGANFYSVTNKRIIQYKDGKYKEIPLSEIVGVYPIRSKMDSRSLATAFIPVVNVLTRPQVMFEFEVSTFKGIEKIEGLKGTPAYCGMFWRFTTIALDDYEKGREHVASKIAKLNLG